MIKFIIMKQGTVRNQTSESRIMSDERKKIKKSELVKRCSPSTCRMLLQIQVQWKLHHLELARNFHFRGNKFLLIFLINQFLMELKWHSFLETKYVVFCLGSTEKKSVFTIPQSLLAKLIIIFGSILLFQSASNKVDKNYIVFRYNYS